MPADNRVKCGSCSAEFSLKAPAKPSGQSKSDAAKVSSEKTEKSKSSAPGSAKPTSSNPTASKPTSAKPTSTNPPSAKPAASKPSAKPATVSAGKSSASSATAEADDPFAAIDLNSLGKSKRVDLGVAPVQTGAMESPSGGMAPWLPGNAPAYVPIPQAEAAAASKGGGKAGNEVARIAPAAKKSNLGVTIAVIAVLVMMAGGSIVAAIIVASK